MCASPMIPMAEWPHPTIRKVMIRIITIEREYGCGAAGIARELAARLGWKGAAQFQAPGLRVRSHAGACALAALRRFIIKSRPKGKRLREWHSTPRRSAAGRPDSGYNCPSPKSAMVRQRSEPAHPADINGCRT